METMTTLPALIESSDLVANATPLTYQLSKQLKEEAIWQGLAGIPLNLAIEEWLDGLSPLTKKNYSSGVNQLSMLCLLHLGISVQQFAEVDHDIIVDSIKKIPGLSEATKQARAALYISLTRFLSRKTKGIVKRAIPNSDGTLNTTKTFGAVREKVKSEALSPVEWARLIEALHNGRDAIIVKLCLQGAKRISEVLNLTIDKVDCDKRKATFQQSKTGGIEKEITVTMPESLAEDLRVYIGDRKEGFVFETRTRKPVLYTQVYEAMKRAAVKAKLAKNGKPINVHPHTMRCSAITFLRSQGVSDCEILRLTGHSSTKMLNQYDKTSQEENASKRFALV